MYLKDMLSPVEEIKSRIDIIDLIGSYVRLQKAGANHKAPCPFHNEKTPSFMVSPARQIWHCFGCSRGGDIFRFIMEIEGMDFPEALKFLADRAGIVVKKEDPALRSERNRLLALMEEAAKFFESNLAIGLPSDNTAALEYLRRRGLKKETIKEFRLGYAPDEWRTLSSYLAQKGFTAAEMEKAGLAVGRGQTPTNAQTNADGQRQSALSQRESARSCYDRFRGRIMFPIFDYQGRVIAFGGRILEVPTPERVGTPSDSVGAKYINSPETMLYQKGKVLYGLHAAKSYILKEGRTVVVEGYMDAIMTYQAGVRNVVASSGTAIGADQVRVLKRLCDHLVMAFDMDLAGQAAADRGIQLALKSGFDITVMDLGSYKDPAEAVTGDSLFFQNAVKNARHIVQFYIDSALRFGAPHTPECKRACERMVLPVIASLASELERAHWVRALGDLLHIGEDVLWRALSRIRSGDGTHTNDELSSSIDSGRNAMPRKLLLEERILGMLATFPVLASQHLMHVNDILFAQDRLEILLHLRGGAVLADSARTALARITLEAEMTATYVVDLKDEFTRCYRELEREHVKEQMGKLSAEIRRAELESSSQLPELLSEFKKLSQQL